MREVKRRVRRGEKFNPEFVHTDSTNESQSEQYSQITQQSLV